MNTQHSAKKRTAHAVAKPPNPVLSRYGKLNFTIRIRARTEEARALEAFAAAQGLSLSAFVRNAVNTFLEKGNLTHGRKH